MKRINWTSEDLNKLPRTKGEALTCGSKYYYSGISCPRGHNAARTTENNQCAECRRERVRLSAKRRRRRLGIKTLEPIMPIAPGIRIHNLTATGGFKRLHVPSSKRIYTKVYHEVRCDCGEILWIVHAAWGKQSQCLKCSNHEKLVLAQQVRQQRSFVSEHRSNTVEADILYAARNRARLSGIEFELTITDIKIPEYCPILGFKLDTSPRGMKKTSNRTPRFNAPSLDRNNPNLGYTKDNVQVVSYRANRLKTNGTAFEHLKVAEFMERMGVSG
jgi:hypothetical protein